MIKQVIPHEDQGYFSISCGIITVSDTRCLETDSSGRYLLDQLQNAGHSIVYYGIVPDDPAQVRSTVITLQSQVQVIILNGGTGIARRDTTYEAIAELLTKTLPGFGELFRFLSYQEIGSRAMASRAIAGVYETCLIFALPGSTAGVKLGFDRLIFPELIHLVKQLQS